MSDVYLRRDCCPICGAPSTLAEPAIRSQPAAESLPLDALGAFASGYDSRRVFFSYHRCRRCAGLYCPVYLKPDQLDRLYSHQPENQAAVRLAAREATAQAYFDILRRHATLEGEYLEIGPDIGLFAGLCAEAGRFSRFHLFEPNQDVHPIMAARLAGRDMHISAAAYGKGVLSPATLSTAVIIHVLDHLIEPTAPLGALYDDLAPGGTLFIATHDEASLLARILGKRWPPYTLQHPQLFSARSIARLLERCGFRVVESTKTVNYFPLTYLVRSLFTVLGLELLAPRFNHPSTISLKLGNIATVARKPA